MSIISFLSSHSIPLILSFHPSSTFILIHAVTDSKLVLSTADSNHMNAIEGWSSKAYLLNLKKKNLEDKMLIIETSESRALDT